MLGSSRTHYTTNGKCYNGKKLNVNGLLAVMQKKVAVQNRRWKLSFFGQEILHIFSFQDLALDLSDLQEALQDVNKCLVSPKEFSYIFHVSPTVQFDGLLSHKLSKTSSMGPKAISLEHLLYVLEITKKNTMFWQLTHKVYILSVLPTLCSVSGKLMAYIVVCVGNGNGSL